MHVCSWIDLGVTTTVLTIDEWLRPYAPPSTTVAEILRDYLEASDETFEYIFYERKKDALTFLYNLLKKADRTHMPEAIFTGITVEPVIDLKCPEEGTSFPELFLDQNNEDMKWPMLPALHYEQIPSRLCTADCLGSYPVPMEYAFINRGVLKTLHYAEKMFDHTEHH